MSETPTAGFFASLLKLLSGLFRRQPAPPAPLPPDGPGEPARIITARVLVLVFDPVMDPATGRRLSEQQGWRRVEDLATGYMSDILNASAGMARYQIVERLDLAEFPPLADGYRYTPEAYRAVLRGAAAPHSPAMVDYGALLARFNILRRVARNEIDEVWVFAFPHAGFYESVMGGAGAFWCNAPPLRNTATCPRRFVIMGFSCERGVGEMLEAFGHRVESIMARVFEHTAGEANLWERFTRYDLTHPGRAEVGTIHFAPNSERDYDWANPRKVLSYCDTWYRFPDLDGPERRPREVHAAEWGGGDIRAHHQWWLRHLPHMAGRTNGVHHNWWQYIQDPNLAP